MEQNNRGIQKDELRMRFTAWLGKVMSSVRADYLEELSKIPKTVDIYSLPEGTLVWEDCYDFETGGKTDFYFEDKRITEALQHLSKKGKEVLKLTFIYQFDTREISASMRCTDQAVYMQRSRAIAYLQKVLSKESENEKTSQPGGISGDPGKGKKG